MEMLKCVYFNENCIKNNHIQTEVLTPNFYYFLFNSSFLKQNIGNFLETLCFFFLSLKFRK